MNVIFLELGNPYELVIATRIKTIDYHQAYFFIEATFSDDINYIDNSQELRLVDNTELPIDNFNDNFDWLTKYKGRLIRAWTHIE